MLYCVWHPFKYFISIITIEQRLPLLLAWPEKWTKGTNFRFFMFLCTAPILNIVCRSLHRNLGLGCLVQKCMFCSFNAIYWKLKKSNTANFSLPNRCFEGEKCSKKCAAFTVFRNVQALRQSASSLGVFHLFLAEF